MAIHFSDRCEWEPFGPASGLRGAAIVMGMGLLLAGCGHGPDNSSPAPASSTKPAASAVATSVPPASAAALPTQLPPTAAASAALAQRPTGAANAKLAAMGIPDLLAAAREAYSAHRLVAPAGDNAMEYYEAVLARDPDNQVARDALRETFPFGVPEVEKAISRNDFEEAGREIELLTRADPTNYTLTLLRSKLDAQRKLQARVEQAQMQAQLLDQKVAELAATRQAAAAKAAEEQAAAAKLAAAEQAPANVTAPPKPATPAPPPKPEGKTRAAQVIAPAAPEYPLQAARNQTSGYAVVEFTVAVDGSVEDPHIVDSSPRRVFDSSAVQAVQQSRFKPALKDGEPVTSTLRRRIAFQFGG